MQNSTSPDDQVRPGVSQRTAADLQIVMGRVVSLLEELEPVERAYAYHLCVEALFDKGLRPEAGWDHLTRAASVGIAKAALEGHIHGSGLLSSPGGRPCLD